MKFSRGFALHRIAILSALAAPAAQAASLAVQVTDAAGKPLPHAVVMLEPASGKLPVAPLAGVEISQAKRQFSPQVTVVTVGTAVQFPNFDTVRHHVYSFSPAKHFELKLYAGTPSTPVVFDKPGVVVLGCNIHDQMLGWVVVVDTPLYAVSASAGRAQIASVAAGAYKLKVWHAGLPADQQAVITNLTIAAADVEQTVKLPVAAAQP
ncbi:methylamine utilization protein [Piscinibacter terrae]|uniref:Methylamine utilization protein n=1 Tax=Piscinibacter terrae TaxID=2496871 RepID=A0A3N7K0H3_9BURK|nr:methylamine utilization protein [Albitalea terrae]RQP24515.1 methylamine utilization protein [Albitalea terrae]